jgi:ABC-type transporter Mla MlaB component
MGREEAKSVDIMQPDGSQEIVISCGELLGISMLHELHESMKQALASGLPIEIDASSVERVDAAGLQLLCAFVSEATASRRMLRWRQPTRALRDAVRLLELNNLLALPVGDLAFQI